MIKKLLLGVSICVIGIGTANAKTIYKSQEYISSLSTSCEIEIQKHLTMSITVICGNGKHGNCSGHKIDDYFVCRTGSGAQNSSSNGAQNSINWILNNL